MVWAILFSRRVLVLAIVGMLKAVNREAVFGVESVATLPEELFGRVM